MENAEHILLVVQNDGNGTQCGFTYQQRKNVVLLEKGGRASTWLLMATQTNQWLRLHGYETASVVEELRAAIMIAEYYFKHVKECDV